MTDFILCYDELEKMMGDDVDLILWFEDDVVLMDKFFPTLTSILTHHTARLARDPWLDIKLYLIPALRGGSASIILQPQLM